MTERTCKSCGCSFELERETPKKRIHCYECSPTRSGTRERKPPPGPRACAHCGEVFTPYRKRDARFCSSGCANNSRSGTVPLKERKCVVCGGQVPAGRSVNCSRSCAIKANDQRAKAKPGTAERRRAYNKAWLDRSGRTSPNRDPKKICPQCGKAGVGYQFTYCSTACAGAGRSAIPKPPKPCATCSEPTGKSTHKFCASCRLTAAELRRRSARGPLLVAYEDGDWPSVVGELLAKTERVGSCANWLGKINKSGYGRLSIQSKDWAVHRLMAQAANGGTKIPSHMPVHHKCGNSSCINPEHLQVVTPHENAAEMLERNSYLSRIADLEDALSSVSPNHPLLAERPRQLRIIA